MKLSKPILIEYLVIYILMNMNYFDLYYIIDDSKKVVNFRKKIEKLSTDKWNLEVELVKCTGLDEKKTFFEMKRVIKKKLYDKMECSKISEKLVKLIIKKNKLYYSKGVINYLERVLKYVVETNKGLEKLGGNLNNRKMEKINESVKVYINDRIKLLKRGNKSILNEFNNMIKKFGYLDKDISKKDVEKKIRELIKRNKDIEERMKKVIRDMKSGAKNVPKLNRKKVFTNYNKYSLNFV